MPTTPFLNMFGRSPIRPLEEHMSKAHACVGELLLFFEKALAGDWHHAELHQQNIVRLENEADIVKRELRTHLPKSLFMPVSRIDLLEILNVQDRLGNKAKDIAGLVLGRKLGFPISIKNPYLTFLKRSIDASHQANTAIHELDELIETSFSGNEIKLVESMIAKLSRIEHDTDDKQIELRQLMYQEEKTLSPIDAMFIYKVIEWTGELANHAEDIGDRLQILLAR